MINKIRLFLQKSFITGILTTLPLFVTFWFVLFIFEKFSGFFLPYLFLINHYFGISMPYYMQKFISFFLVILIFISVGVAARNYFGRKILKLITVSAEKIPIVRSIYSSIRQVVEAFQTAGGGSFKKVVMIEYPRQGLYSMGFMRKYFHSHNA